MQLYRGFRKEELKEAIGSALAEGSQVHILPFKELLILGDKLKKISCSF